MFIIRRFLISSSFVLCRTWSLFRFLSYLLENVDESNIWRVFSDNPSNEWHIESGREKMSRSSSSIFMHHHRKVESKQKWIVWVFDRFQLFFVCLFGLTMKWNFDLKEFEHEFLFKRINHSVMNKYLIEKIIENRTIYSKKTLLSINQSENICIGMTYHALGAIENE